MSVNQKFIMFLGYKIENPTQEQINKYVDNDGFDWDFIFDGMSGKYLYFGSKLSQLREYGEQYGFDTEDNWSLEYIVSTSKTLKLQFQKELGFPELHYFIHYF